MPFALIMVGGLLMILAWNNTEGQFFSLVKTDFQGGGFIVWIIAIAVIGGLGYIPSLQPISRAFLVLVLLVLVLKSGQGFFAQFSQATKTGQQTAQSPLALPQPTAIGAT